MRQSELRAGDSEVRLQFRAGMEDLRATQNMVGYMGFCWRHKSLTAIEVAWRWAFGVPFLMIAWGQAQRILTEIPPSVAGLDRLEWQNPWASAVVLSQAIGRYEPLVLDVLRWLAPLGVVGWAAASTLGRMLILQRMRTLDRQVGETRSMAMPVSSVFRRLPGFAALQALWMLALLACFWLWYGTVSWASATYITSGAQPDLVGYLCWLIFLSLGIFTLWALLSWTLAMVPLLLVLEDDKRPGATLRALLGSFRLGRRLSGKLLEVNLVMAIVKIALIVLAMVFSAAPLPFSDEFGAEMLHAINLVVAIWYLLANDFFHVVRIRSFCELWRHYRAPNL